MTCSTSNFHIIWLSFSFLIIPWNVSSQVPLSVTAWEDPSGADKLWHNWTSICRTWWSPCTFVLYMHKTNFEQISIKIPYTSLDTLQGTMTYPTMKRWRQRKLKEWEYEIVPRRVHLQEYTPWNSQRVYPGNMMLAKRLFPFGAWPIFRGELSNFSVVCLLKTPTSFHEKFHVPHSKGTIPRVPPFSLSQANQSDPSRPCWSTMSCLFCIVL